MQFLIVSNPDFININVDLLTITKIDVLNQQTLKKGACQRYWITVHVPENTKAGIYEGQVNIRCNGLKGMVGIPVKFRVLDFKLRKDPNKHFTAYFGPPEEQYRGMKGDLYETAVKNELQSMLDHGIDIIPTVYTDGDGDHVILSEKRKQLIDRMLEMGFTGPVPVYAGSTIQSMILKHEGIEYKSHWKIDRLPSEGFYKKVTGAFTEFREMWEKNGWPDLYVCPIDEVDPVAREFGVSIYKAVRDAGIKTYITKESTSQDASQYGPYVNAWCSQPYDVSYETATAGDFEYWSYPNHNAGEKRNRMIMFKGGRMTYGFGLWRSGFTLLIPWHWRWLTSGDQFEYIRPFATPFGMRMDEKGNMIPAVNWECFREGYDDLRYIYTLEQEIEEHRGAKECAGLVNESEKFLQDVWKSIKVQPSYLKTNMWPSEEFNMIRWKIAAYISELSAYPSDNNTIAPSVLKSIEMLPMNGSNENDKLIERMLKEHLFEVLDLGRNDFSGWYSGAKEGSIRIIEKRGKDHTAAMEYTVIVDQKKDGEKKDGKYPVGWPGISIGFENGEIDLPSYDYLFFYVKVNSDRDKTIVKNTPFFISIKMYDENPEKTALAIDPNTKKPKRGIPGDFYRGYGVSYGYLKNGKLLDNATVKKMLKDKADGNSQIVESVMEDVDTVVYKYTINKNSYDHDANFIIFRAANIHMYYAEMLIWRVYIDDGQESRQVLNSLNYVNDGSYNEDSRQMGVRGRVGFADGDEALYVRNVVYQHDSINNEVIGYKYLNSLEDKQRHLEELFLEERAREMAFEGERFYDLMRIAKRRGEPSFLANIVASKFSGAKKEEIRDFLMDPANWYIPLYDVQ